MDNSGMVSSLDIVGYAAKTEELKAELLSCLADVFKDTAMGSRVIVQESRFANLSELLLVLANRCGMDLELLLKEICSHARSGVVKNDAFSGDHKAVIELMNAHR